MKELQVFMDTRKQQQIKISREADAAIDEVITAVGMTKVELLSRVCGWFAVQSPVVQRAVLGLLPSELMADARRLMIESLTPVQKADASRARGGKEAVR
jgi:hypothetical protein